MTAPDPTPSRIPAWASFTLTTSATLTGLLAVFAGIPALVEAGPGAVLIAFVALVGVYFLIGRWTR